MSVLGRWLHELDVRRAERVVTIPGGAALLHSSYPRAHSHNKLSVVADTDGAGLAAAAASVLGGAGCSHLLVEVRTPRDERARAGLEQAGFTRSEEVVMVWEGGRPRQHARHRVEELSLSQRAQASVEEWARELPGAEPETWRQLGARIETVVGGARATFLGITGAEGDVLARTDVYLHGGVAQVEEVVSAEAARGQGMGGALVAAAVECALREGAQEVILVAEADDWPKAWYERMGFRVAEVHSSFRRGASGGA